jgi:hypothetical protein
MGRHQNIDEVELQYPDCPHGAPIMPDIIRRSGTRAVKALRGQGDAPCLTGGNPGPAA